MKNKARPRKGRASNRLAALVLIFCAGAAAALCFLAAQELGERRESKSYYETLSDALVRTTDAPTARPTQTAAPEGQETAAPSAEPEETPAPAGSAVDFETLRETCPDAVGWIAIEGTQIDYPVVQGSDNSFYLNHMPDGKANEAGSIMLDAACDGVFGDEINILHGHHMKNHSMFGGLDDYKQEAYYWEHPVLWLYTPAGDFEVAIFAAYTVDGEAFGYPTAFRSDEEFERFLKQAREKSAFHADVDVQRGDRLLLLSTCSYSFESERLLVVGKIIDPATEN